MGYNLTLVEPLKFPLDVSLISPEKILEKTPDEVKALEIWEGNRKRRVGELFKIETNQDDSLTLYGDLQKTRRLGRNMENGFLTVKGNAGLYVGEGMRGGKIIVEGSTEGWLGSRMTGGEIIVEGDAGDFVGSSYRGSREGMSGGFIQVKGNAGDEVGCWMKGGTIWIDGDVGCFPGIHMGDGCVVVGGNCRGRAGAEMTGGKVIIRGKIPQVLPSFQTSEIKKKVKVEGNTIEGPFYLFIGDVNEGNGGKLYINKGQNPHLSWCEELMGEVD